MFRAWAKFRHGAAALGLAASLLFAYLAVRNVDFHVFWRGMRESDYIWMVPSFLALVVAISLRAVRWQLLFRRETRPPLGPTTRALLIGYLFNNILPARAGEAARVVALHQDAGTSRGEALGTAVAERVYDILALIVLLVVAAPFLPHVDWLRRAAIVGLVLAAGLVVTILVLKRYRERPLQFLLRPLARVPHLSRQATDRFAHNIVRGLGVFLSSRLALPAIGVTFASWLIAALSFWLALLGFDRGAAFGAGLLALIATNLALVIPSSPGAVGVFEAAVLVALHPYGYDRSHALAYAVVLHAVNFFPYLIVGAWALHSHVRRVRARRPGTPAVEELAHGTLDTYEGDAARDLRERPQRKASADLS